MGDSGGFDADFGPVCISFLNVLFLFLSCMGKHGQSWEICWASIYSGIWRLFWIMCQYWINNYEIECDFDQSLRQEIPDFP